jgi:hypothetical protein
MLLPCDAVYRHSRKVWAQFDPAVQPSMYALDLEPTLPMVANTSRALLADSDRRPEAAGGAQRVLQHAPAPPARRPPGTPLPCLLLAVPLNVDTFCGCGCNKVRLRNCFSCLQCADWRHTQILPCAAADNGALQRDTIRQSQSPLCCRTLWATTRAAPCSASLASGRPMAPRRS